MASISDRRERPRRGPPRWGCSRGWRARRPRGNAVAGRHDYCAGQGLGSGRSRLVARLWFRPPERDS
eukprot:8890181-Pyramimonas_sp.AAC.1